MCQGLRLLKRKSCKGCDQCGYLRDDLHERMCDEGIILPEIEHDALYTIKVTNVSHDYESGFVDDWDLEAVKITEEPTP